MIDLRNCSEQKKGETTQLDEVESLESGEDGVGGKGVGKRDTVVAVSDTSGKN